MRNVPLIIMGDTNMRCISFQIDFRFVLPTNTSRPCPRLRVTETDKVERALNCRDVRTPLTFDTRVNWCVSLFALLVVLTSTPVCALGRYHGKPTSDSRGGYASRYDRVLLRGSVRLSLKEITNGVII